ncbi:hypothetical protein [Frigoriglobus tundricola]|uniref:Lipoprotein n=1 Tax=Frigoriglobus tundricola TaxID=2774151 RepID=A0A6M5Z3B7_9BACT|nr:hypothetical protein [Frigoriglobus tundricola]QJX00031.1 hypothetical protein FTUN_7653 [Frigoriglobus tundricola]
MIRYAVALAGLLVACCAASCDDKDPVKDKLFAAKKAYDAEMKLYRKAAEEWFDKREGAARNDGNKKLVDQVKAERATFEGSGALPKAVPAAIPQQAAAANKALEAAYQLAVKEYLIAKDDAAAAGMEIELKQFRATRPDAKADAKDAYPVGTILSGQLRWNGDPGDHSYLIVVTERTGKGFRGVARLDYGPSGDPKRKALYDIDGEITPQGLKYKGEVPGLGQVEGKWVKDVLQITASADNGGTLSGGLRFKKN